MKEIRVMESMRLVWTSRSARGKGSELQNPSEMQSTGKPSREPDGEVLAFKGPQGLVPFLLSPSVFFTYKEEVEAPVGARKL